MLSRLKSVSRKVPFSQFRRQIAIANLKSVSNFSTTTATTLENAQNTNNNQSKSNPKQKMHGGFKLFGGVLLVGIGGGAGYFMYQKLTETRYTELAELYEIIDRNGRTDVKCNQFKKRLQDIYFKYYKGYENTEMTKKLFFDEVVSYVLDYGNNEQFSILLQEYRAMFVDYYPIMFEKKKNDHEFTYNLEYFLGLDISNPNDYKLALCALKAGNPAFSWKYVYEGLTKMKFTLSQQVEIVRAIIEGGNKEIFDYLIWNGDSVLMTPGQFVTQFRSSSELYTIASNPELLSSLHQYLKQDEMMALFTGSINNMVKNNKLSKKMVIFFMNHFVENPKFYGNTPEVRSGKFLESILNLVKTFNNNDDLYDIIKYVDETRGQDPTIFHEITGCLIDSIDDDNRDKIVYQIVDQCLPIATEKIYQFQKNFTMVIHDNLKMLRNDKHREYFESLIGQMFMVDSDGNTCFHQVATEKQPQLFLLLKLFQGLKIEADKSGGDFSKIYQLLNLKNKKGVDVFELMYSNKPSHHISLEDLMLILLKHDYSMSTATVDLQYFYKDLVECYTFFAEQGKIKSTDIYDEKTKTTYLCHAYNDVGNRAVASGLLEFNNMADEKFVEAVVQKLDHDMLNRLLSHVPNAINEHHVQQLLSMNKDNLVSLVDVENHYKMLETIFVKHKTKYQTNPEYIKQVSSFRDRKDYCKLREHYEKISHLINHK